MEPELQSCDINAAKYLFLNCVRLKKKNRETLHLADYCIDGHGLKLRCSY